MKQTSMNIITANSGRVNNFYQPAGIDRLLSRLDRVKRAGPDRWVACCPAHDDRNPSLSIRLAPDGRVLLHCFAGCTANEVVAAVGLRLTDLFENQRITSLKQAAIPPSHNRDLADYARLLWEKADRDDKAVAGHPYAIQKGIGWAAGAGRVIASGSIIGKNSDCIIIPVRTNATGEVQAVQAINAQGRKQTFGTLSGGCLVLGNTLDKSLRWFVCEGWATAVAAVFHFYGGNAVAAVSFGKHRLEQVAEIIARVFEPDCLTILGEHDD